MKILQGFSKAKETAEKILNEQDKVRETLEDARRKAEKEKHRISNSLEQLKLLIQMVYSYLNGEYTKIPWKTLILALAAILYFLNPLDIVPDFIPGLGYLDDAVVLAFVANSLKSDLEAFKYFKQQIFTEDLHS